MPTAVYTGTISIDVFNGSTIQPNTTHNRTLPFNSSKIGWETPNLVPGQFTDITLAELYASADQFKLTFTTSMQTSLSGLSTVFFGEQINDPSDPRKIPPNVLVKLPRSNGTIDERRYISSLRYGVFSRVATLEVNDTFPFDVKFTEPTDAVLTFYNTGDTEGNRWTNVFGSFTLNIRVEMDCTGDNLGEPVCMNICRESLPTCYQEYRRWCFPDRVETEPLCAEFIGEYIQKIGPTAELDEDLNRFCSSRFEGFHDLFDVNDQFRFYDLCACQMNPEQYETFRGQLAELFPAFANLPYNSRCMVPRCASSPIKNISTGKVCPVPNCVNYAQFTNTGTFNESTITVNQRVSGCGSLIPPPPPPPSPETKPQSYGLIITIFVVIAILILAATILTLLF